VTAPGWLDELPLEPGPPWLAMGTRGLDGDRWLVVDDDRVADLAGKARLLRDERGTVFGALDTPEVAAGSTELLELVTLATGAEPDRAIHPLDAAARLVQEDLCLLVLRDGAPHLDAGSVCFPSYWRLPDKLGLPLADVHGPVPGYAEALAPKVDSFLTRLRPDRIAWRRNWSIHDDPAYFLPASTPPRAVAPPDGLFLRSERQTLRRLTSVDAVVFTIRTQQLPLAALAARPDLARRMAAVIDAWPPAAVDYKGGHGALAAHPWLATR
jgi:hypothetical protein